MVEGDGMFVVGKRKCGVGRYHSKEHVYVILERGTSKIRRIVARDKSADVLSAFAKHLKKDTEMCVDPGTENTYFDNISSVITLHKIPGPIHVDPDNPHLHTQTVERSHGTIKMRLRSGRGVFRHNLQPIMDLEDFIQNRTSGSPASIFKKLGDAAKLYCSNLHDDTIRTSNIPLQLGQDMFEKIEGLTLTKIKSLCSASVLTKSKRYEVIKSIQISTQVFSALNKIEGEFRAARIHDQFISWSQTAPPSAYHPFDTDKISISCTCRYYERVSKKMQQSDRKFCTHIIGQLRRVIFMTK